EKSGLQEETWLLGNAAPLCQYVMECNSAISTIYLCTATGQNIHFDGDAAKKAALGELPPAMERPWYAEAKEKDTLYVSNAYDDLLGRGLCLSVSMPIYSPDGGFAGALGFDILVGEITERLNAGLVDGAYFVLFGTEDVIAAPGLTEDNKDELPVFWDEVRAKPGGTNRVRDGGSDLYITWASVELTDWRLVYVCAADYMTERATRIHRDLVSMSQDTSGRMDKSIRMFALLLAVLLLAVISAAALIAKKLARRIASPILTLTQGAEIIGAGDLEHVLTVRTGDEVERLASTFNTMVANIRQITAEKERIGAELNVAMQIQTSMLPSIFPAVPERPEFDVYACMLPAREVGGDFYDFFFVDEKTLAVVIADVSGKSVPAALFMVIARTLLKNNAQSGLAPADVFAFVNNMLCENNDASMFVTAFMGYLDVPTGRFRYANAGHNPPLIRQGESFAWLPVETDMALAGMEGMSYAQRETVLAPGDVLYLYTDGVTEAENEAEAFFGEDRLLETAEKHRELPPQALAEAVLAEINGFAGGKEQADDVTMLTLRYNGRKRGAK
ncbi:MAG: SpoIIE family protein phosphatase, partial [Clostridiales Family XIII bacterium]|nr:SpoIIE family protein phosphatase [Clostridiales Family XIII bacterium]